MQQDPPVTPDDSARQPDPGAPPKDPAPAPAPPWGSDDQFDAEKAWKLIQDLKGDKEKLAKREVLTLEQKTQLAEYNRLVEASKSEDERKAAELERWQAEAERWRKTSVATRIETVAASMDFAYPADAVAQLDPDRYIDAGGVIDEAAIKNDLTQVLEQRPLWRKPTEPAGPRVPAPNPSQGSGGGAGQAMDPRQQFAAILQQGLTRS